MSWFRKWLFTWRRMDPPMDSIDGLGLTFDHLSSKGKQVALFRAQERARRGQLTDEQRDAIDAAHKSAKNLSDKNQAVLRALTTKET